jgi:hypothetical protein
VHVGTAALAAAVTVGSLSVSRPASLEHAQALPDHSSFCVLVHVGTATLAAALTVGSASALHSHADPVHFRYPDEQVLTATFA